MGVMAREVVFCVLVVLQLLCASQCYQLVPIHSDRKLQELPKRGLKSSPQNVHKNVYHSNIHYKDNDLPKGTKTSSKSTSKKFQDNIKQSHHRLDLLQKIQQGDLKYPVSYGSSDYVMYLSLGTPPQEFRVTIDTGSDLCWLQCLPCTQCYSQLDPMFNPKLSSTFSLAKCNDPFCKALPLSACQLQTTCNNQRTCSQSSTCFYVYPYGKGSIWTQGDLAFEAVTFNASVVGYIAFGCGHNQQGTFARADGLIGLGRGPLSLPSQLSPTVAQIFSYCLVDRFANSSSNWSSPITFGDAPENSRATYTPMYIPKTSNPFVRTSNFNSCSRTCSSSSSSSSSCSSSCSPSTSNSSSTPTNAAASTFYYVTVTGITVGGRKLNMPRGVFEFDSNSGKGGVILDSGTTITYWRNEAFNQIINALRQQIHDNTNYREVDSSQYNLSLCYDISGSSDQSDWVNTLPSMVVHMTNVNFKIPVSNLFFVADDNSGQTICLAMESSDQISIIGNFQQQNNLIVYDMVKQRIGFKAVTDCATL